MFINNTIHLLGNIGSVTEDTEAMEIDELQEDALAGAPDDMEEVVGGGGGGGSEDDEGMVLN